MKLHLDKSLFQEAIQATAQHIGIPEVYVEKDYWVSLVLLEIFSSEISDLVVFKGGTCLSKCHNLIQRFSEDIDLVIIPVKGEPTNQFSKRMKMVSKIVEKILPETHIEGYTNKRGNIRKTVHQYDKVFDSNLVQVADHLILEASLLGNSEPFTKQKISSYLLDFMIHAGTEDLIKKHNMAAFNEWLKNHPGSAIIFDSPEKVWSHIMKAYQGSFKQMVYGELPSESDLLDTLGKISKRIKPIDWQVGR